MMMRWLKPCFAILFSCLSYQLQAQNTRYIDPVFSEVETSTLGYSDVFTAASHTMDVYQPKGDTQSIRPLIIYIHGGAFYAGDKATQDCIDFCTHFAKKGYVAVSVNYRLANALLFLLNQDVQLEAVLKSMADVKAAIRFFGKDAQTTNEYRIDTNAVFIGGYSAGAVSALHTAWVDSEAELDSKLVDILKKSVKTLDGDAGNLGYPCRVKAVFSFAGALYKTSYANADDQPVWLGHAKDDGTVSYNCAPALNNPMVLTLCGTGKVFPRLDSVGVKYDTMILNKGDHAWPGLGNKGADFLQAVEEIAEFFYPMLPGSPSLNATSELNSPKIRLYPNPNAKESVFIRGDVQGIQGVEFFDWSGRLVSQHQNLSVEAQAVELPVDQLPAGVYTVVITHAQGQKVCQRLQRL